MPDGTRIRGAAIVLAGAWLAGCSGGSGGASGVPPSTGNAPSTNASASVAVTAPADVLDPIVADAATRASVDKSAVAIVRASSETWPNGALGCPSPGVMYTQAVVTGWQVVVEAGGTQYDYRSSGAGRFKLCTSGASGDGSPGGSGAPG